MDCLSTGFSISFQVCVKHRWSRSIPLVSRVYLLDRAPGLDIHAVIGLSACRSRKTIPSKRPSGKMYYEHYKDAHLNPTSAGFFCAEILTIYDENIYSIGLFLMSDAL